MTFAAGVNSALQIAVEPTMRGRVMALYSIVFLGSTPIGAPLVGWLAEVAGPRAGLLAGGRGAPLVRGARSPRRRARTRGVRIVVAMPTSPLETVARNHGAVMAARHGRRVPAHFGSTAAEEAVCLRGVGMADRSDRETFELRGTPEAIEQALVALGERGLGLVRRADRAVVRCEPGDACGRC